MKTNLKYIIMFAVCLIAFPFNAKAECSVERIAELSKIASNVQTSYNYEIIEEGPHFNVDFTNVTNDIYIIEDVFGKKITRDSNQYYGPYYGTSVSFTVYSNDNNCKGEKIVTKYLSIPEYNKYSISDECKANPDFKYCQMWMNTTELSQEDFEKSLKNYIKTKNETDTEEDSSNVILDFLKANIKIIIIIIALAILLPLLIKLKRRTM